MRLTRLPSRVAGPGIQTVPITNCAVMTPALLAEASRRFEAFAAPAWTQVPR